MTKVVVPLAKKTYYNSIPACKKTDNSKVKTASGSQAMACASILLLLTNRS